MTTKNRRSEDLVAAVLVAPFVLIFGWMFIYPTLQMLQLSFTKSPLIGAGTWVGFDNYIKMFNDRTFWTAIWNTSYFVLLTVVPGTAAAMVIAALDEPLAALGLVGLLAALPAISTGRCRLPRRQPTSAACAASPFNVISFCPAATS